MMNEETAGVSKTFAHLLMVGLINKVFPLSSRMFACCPNLTPT
jgi:hypothetical protein